MSNLLFKTSIFTFLGCALLDTLLLVCLGDSSVILDCLDSISFDVLTSCLISSACAVVIPVAIPSADKAPIVNWFFLEIFLLILFIPTVLGPFCKSLLILYHELWRNATGTKKDTYYASFFIILMYSSLYSSF